MEGIKDKVVVITGASSGIGEATALMLAERGAKVVLGATGPDRLKAVAGRIVEAGGEAAHAKTDVRRRDEVTNLINMACERYGQLDVLVNNAGIGPISPFGQKTRRARCLCLANCYFAGYRACSTCYMNEGGAIDGCKFPR
jgi:NADP-dependent 3-hydroxy acid dehydrogenase YdfG